LRKANLLDRELPREAVRALHNDGGTGQAMKTAVAVGLGAALLSAAIAVSPADAASRKKRARAHAAPPPAARVVQPPIDRFLACDVRVRDYLREGGAAARVTKISIDDVRLQMSIQHEFGEAGKTTRRYLRGDSEEEMRNTLRGILEEFRMAVEAAEAGRAWYVIAPRKVMPESRDGSAEGTSPWVAVVLADIGGKCRPVAFYQSVDRDRLDPELSKKLDE
jgi:hypothetical protein